MLKDPASKRASRMWPCSWVLWCSLSACSPQNGDGASDANAPHGDTGSVEAHGSAREQNLDGGTSGPRAETDANAPASDQRDGEAQRDKDAAPNLTDAPSPHDAASLPDGGRAEASVSRMGFPPVQDLGVKGPFSTNDPQGQNEGPDCSVHRPAELGKGGVRHPIVIWGMGTGGFNTYQESFDLWASHGFIVAAALLGDGQGDGSEMLACLQYVCDHYASNVDCRAGASGHSQGAAGAIMTGTDPRVLTTAPIQPYTAQGFGGFDEASIRRQRGPMLLLSGTDDFIATPSTYQQPVFDTTNVPVVWANLIGGEHVTTGLDGAASYRKVVLAWFRLQLMDDQDFRSMFYGQDCGLCKDAMWMVQRKQTP